MNRTTRRRADALTSDMFAMPRPAAQIPGSMDFRQPISLLVGDMLKDAHAAGIDRFEIAARASRLAGRDVSKAMLDGYTAESREEFNVPLWLAPVLEVVDFSSPAGGACDASPAGLPTGPTGPTRGGDRHRPPPATGR